MGADLTICKLEDTARGGWEVSDEAVESGYFRDCYNSGGLFAFLTLNTGKSFSWWQMDSNNKHWFSKRDHKLMAKYVPEFRKKVASVQKKIDKMEIGYYKVEDYDPEYAKIEGEEFPQPWGDGKNKYKKKAMSKEELDEYKKWYNNLLKFCDKAIELKSGIHWSI